MDEITMNVKKKDPQDNSLLITPAAFYWDEGDKTKLNWFLYSNVGDVPDKMYFREITKSSYAR